jgi:hypothetical protein
MELLCLGIQLAGFVQLLVAAANLFAVRMFDYRENMRRMSPVVREVFVVQNVYVVLTVVALAFAFACLLFPRDLTGDTPLGRYLASFLCVFWTLRTLIQLTVYDRDLRRRHVFLNGLFVLAFVYLSGVFAVAALGLLR